MAVLTPVICGKWWVGLSWGPWAEWGLNTSVRPQTVRWLGKPSLHSLQGLLGLKGSEGSPQQTGTEAHTVLLTGSHFVYQGTLDSVLQIDLEPM